MTVYSRNPATAFVSHDELSSRIEDSNTFYIAHLEKSTISVVDGVGMLIWDLLQRSPQLSMSHKKLYTGEQSTLCNHW